MLFVAAVAGAEELEHHSPGLASRVEQMVVAARSWDPPENRPVKVGVIVPAFRRDRHVQRTLPINLLGSLPYIGQIAWCLVLHSEATELWNGWP